MRKHRIHMFAEILYKSIERKNPNKVLEKTTKDADIQRKLYTGKDLDKILFDYRKRETDSQKEQRKRITIGRSKHIIRQIENVIDQLDIMDKPSINVIHDNETISENLLSYIYNNNIAKLAFDWCKYYNLVDANTWIVCRQIEDEVIFEEVNAYNLYDLKVQNGAFKYVIFRFERKVAEQTVYDFELYHNEGLLVFTNKAGKTRDQETQMHGEFIVTEYQYKRMFCFPCGYQRDADNQFKTFVSLLDPASELFKGLIWQGSDMDTELAAHGVIQKYAYAQKCNWTYQNEESSTECHHGFLFKDGINTNTKCSNCGGTGLVTHTTSQDIITFPLPNEGEQVPLKLSDLSHTVFMPETVFSFKKQYVKELEVAIMQTIFNNSVTLTQSEIQVTATEKVIDLQGIYSTLNKYGQHVSDMFIWMMECYSELNGIEGAEFLHGYTLNMKLENVETLSETRKKLIDANAPIEVIKAYDLAILRKQHLDSPQFINRFSVWEQYRPFNDKSDVIAMQILSGLPNINRSKILYNFWGRIRRNIETVHGDKFFEYKDERRKELINAEVEIVRAELLEDEPQRLTSNDFDI